MTHLTPEMAEFNTKSLHTRSQREVQDPPTKWSIMPIRNSSLFKPRRMWRSSTLPKPLKLTTMMSLQRTGLGRNLAKSSLLKNKVLMLRNKTHPINKIICLLKIHLTSIERYFSRCTLCFSKLKSLWTRTPPFLNNWLIRRMRLTRTSQWFICSQKMPRKLWQTK